MAVSGANPYVVWACPTGTVSSGNAGAYMYMSGVISGGAPLTLTFTQFDAGQGYYSSLDVYSCSTASCVDGGTMLSSWQYSGYTLPSVSPVTSSTGIILIRWYSGWSTAGQGWRATWTSPASGQCARSEPPWECESVTGSGAGAGCTICGAGTYSEAGGARAPCSRWDD